MVDLEALAELVQTAVLTLTLIVFIFQFRSQERATKEAAYQELIGRYNEYSLSAASLLGPSLANWVSPGKKLSNDEVTAMENLMQAYGIIEEAFELYEKRWINKDEWAQWDTWLKTLSDDPLFPIFHARVIGMYDKEFQEYVTQVLNSKSPASEGKNP